MKLFLAGVLAFLLIVVAPIGIYRHARYSSERTVTFTITRLPDRELQGNGNGGSNAYANLIYTNKGTFKNTDSTFPWKRNSSDIYGQLNQGKTYTCKVAGWRIGLFSSYPDIISCKGFYQ